MGIFIQFYRSTVGKKIIMAITGLLLIGFLIGHMIGNLKMFAGMDPDTGRYKLDLYAEFLRSMGHEMLGHETALWIVRGGLLACVLLHILMALQLSIINSRARPVGYKVNSYQSSTLASRGMMIGGLILLAFIVFHILHFTTGDLHFRDFKEGHVYANVWKGFQSPLVTGFYLLAMLSVCFHTFHGAWSVFQTLGIDSPKLNPILRKGAFFVAMILLIGFSSVPVAVALNYVKPPVGELIVEGSK